MPLAQLWRVGFLEDKQNGQNVSYTNHKCCLTLSFLHKLMFWTSFYSLAVLLEAQEPLRDKVSTKNKQEKASGDYRFWLPFPLPFRFLVHPNVNSPHCMLLSPKSLHQVIPAIMDPKSLKSSFRRQFPSFSLSGHLCTANVMNTLRKEKRNKMRG